jgi:hypothetical protein
MNEPIPSTVQEVVDLFVSELASLKFGDLEPAGLAQTCEEVKSLAADVARTEIELENARARLADKRDALLQQAQRAHAYARVYAESRPELASRLERITLPRSLRRNSKGESALLFAEPSDAREAPAPTRRRRAPREVDSQVASRDDVGGPAAVASG